VRDCDLNKHRAPYTAHETRVLPKPILQNSPHRQAAATKKERTIPPPSQTKNKRKKPPTWKTIPNLHQSVPYGGKRHILTRTIEILAASSSPIVTAFPTTAALVHVAPARSTTRPAVLQHTAVPTVDTGASIRQTLAAVIIAIALYKIASVGFGEGIR